jgi:hypothetical protein
MQCNTSAECAEDPNLILCALQTENFGWSSTEQSQHVRILANEMLASRLGQFLGLPIPRVEVIEVSVWLIGYTPGLRVEIGATSTPCSSGLQLASLYPPPEIQIFDYLPESLLHKVSNTADFAR